MPHLVPGTLPRHIRPAWRPAPSAAYGEPVWPQGCPRASNVRRTGHQGWTRCGPPHICRRRCIQRQTYGLRHPGRFRGPPTLRNPTLHIKKAYRSRKTIVRLDTLRRQSPDGSSVQPPISATDIRSPVPSTGHAERRMRHGTQLPHASTIPVMQPVRRVARVPATMVHIPSSTISDRRSGMSVLSPPIMMPTLPGLAKPHRA